MRWLLAIALVVLLWYLVWKYEQESAFVVSGGVPQTGFGDFVDSIQTDYPALGELVDEVKNALSTTRADVIRKWADAIQLHEGWFVGSKSYRNNNPGNLRVTGDL